MGATRCSKVHKGHTWPSRKLALQGPSGATHGCKASSKPLAYQLPCKLACLGVQEVAYHPLAQQSAVLAELIAEARASRDEVENLSPSSQV